jgi:hypothetical protein
MKSPEGKCQNLVSVGNNPVMTRACLTALLIVGLLVMPVLAYAAEKKKEPINLYEVPTTGKIIDVEYRPEFDEWWVKCREGDTIAVYSYDKRGNRWGKIVFAPKKRDEQSKPSGLSEGEPPGQEGKPDAGSKPPATKPDSKGDKTKWWDPLNIIKGGEKLIVPSPSPEKK